MQMIRSTSITALLIAALTQAPAFAQSTSAAAATPAASAPAAALADGEVRKVDKETGKLTLRHGPIQSLEMPAMTMVFRVSDPAMLDSVKPGDKVRFAAERKNGAITVTKIEAAK
jgi:Cu(I)/Ag(I) efflux system protein CusF